MPASIVPARSAPARSALSIAESRMSALLRFEPFMLARWRFAPERFAPERSAPERSAPTRKQWLQSTPGAGAGLTVPPMPMVGHVAALAAPDDNMTVPAVTAAAATTRSTRPCDENIDAAPVSVPQDVTTKLCLVVAVPAGVVIVIRPVVAPAGTWVTSVVAVSEMICAGVPLNATFVAPARLEPVMVTWAPTGPDSGFLSVICGVTEVVIRPTTLRSWANQMAPSGPAVIASCRLFCPILTGRVWYRATFPVVVIRPIRSSFEQFASLVNHSAPSDPAVMPSEPHRPGSPKLVTFPAVVIRSMEWLLMSANQSAPSRPAVIPLGEMMLGSVNVVTLPLVVIRPIPAAAVPTLPLMNHRSPSGPVVMALAQPMDGSVNKETFPAVVIRPIAPLTWLNPSVNQRAPSGPVVMPCGLAGPGTGNDCALPFEVIRPIEYLPSLTNQTAPSGPAVIPNGDTPWASAIGPVKFRSVPSVAIRPIE